MSKLKSPHFRVNRETPHFHVKNESAPFFTLLGFTKMGRFHDLHENGAFHNLHENGAIFIFTYDILKIYMKDDLLLFKKLFLNMDSLKLVAITQAVFLTTLRAQ